MAIERRPRETTSARPSESTVRMPRLAPESRSTRVTVAPRSASIIPAKGPGPMPDISTTVIPLKGPIARGCAISRPNALVGALVHERSQWGQYVGGKGGQEPGLVMTWPVEHQVVEAEVEVRLDLGEGGFGVRCHDPTAGHLLDGQRVACRFHLGGVAQAVLLLGCQRQGGPEPGVLHRQTGVRVVGELDLDHPVDQPS